MLKDASHVRDVDAAGDNLTAARQGEGGEPGIKSGAHGERGEGVALAGPKRLQVGLKPFAIPAGAQAKGRSGPEVTVTQVKLLASVHGVNQRVAVVMS